MDNHTTNSFTREKALETLTNLFQSGVRITFDSSAVAREWSGHRLEQSYLFHPLASLTVHREVYKCEDNPEISVYIKELTLGRVPHYHIIPGKVNRIMNTSFCNPNSRDVDSPVLTEMYSSVDHDYYGYGPGVTFSISGNTKTLEGLGFDCSVYSAWTPRFFFQCDDTTPLHFLNSKELSSCFNRGGC